MRVLFCCRPAYGHVRPLLPLAMACRDTGHDVLFGTGEEFVGQLRERGFGAERVGISIEEADRRALQAHPELNDLPREERWRLGLVVFADVLARRTLDDLEPLLHRLEPDLLVHDEMDLGAPVAADAVGIPAVAHSLGRQQPEAIRAPVMARLAEVWRARHPGASPRDLFLANADLDICPPSLRDPSALEPAQRIDMRPVAPVEPGDGVPDWVARPRSRPLVYLTLSTYVRGDAGALPAAAAGLGQLEVDALAMVGPDGDSTALDPLPESVRVERFVPQGVLLPYLDAVVHHGGSGIMLGAFAHGLPQLVLPQGADQFMNAQVVVDSGAGMRLLPEETTSEAVAEAVRALLSDPGYHEAAASVATEIASMPAPAEVVPELARLRGESRA
jgi:UDP:flavonoid glycosyltransferase YjiC (YdhE family)